MILAIAVILIGLYVGANVGANDAANCIGATIGAGLLRFRTAVLLSAAMVIAGALLEGQGVSDTIGKGIVTDPLDSLAVIAALVSGGLLVTAATFRSLPVSTSQSVVGAMAGVGLAGHMHIDWSQTLGIMGTWVLCPVATASMTFVVYRLVLFVLGRIPGQRHARRVMAWLVVGTSAYASYALGAAHLGVAVGPVFFLHLDIISPQVLAVLGAVSIAAGVLFFSRPVIETVGHSIIPLDLPSTFSVQLVIAFGLHVFAIIGVPVSSSQAVVGALAGVGLVQGVRTLSGRKLVEIVVGWVATPTLAGLLAFGVYQLLTLL